MTDRSEVLRIAGEYYCDNSYEENFEHLSVIQDELSRLQAEAADINRQMELTQTHRLAVVFVLRASAVEGGNVIPMRPERAGIIDT